MSPLRPLVLSIALMAAVPAAMAGTTTSFGFACYTSNTGASCATYASQLKLDVIDNGNGTVGFKFINNISSLFPGDAARITDIYFDLTGIGSMSPGATVGVVAYGAASPLGAPPGSGAGWANSATDFQFEPIRTFNPNTNPQENALQSGESLVIVGTLAGATTYAQLIAGFNGNLPPTAANRIGLHLQSVGLNAAESEGMYAVPSTTVVPVPGALPMMLGGLLGIAYLARRRKA